MTLNIKKKKSLKLDLYFRVTPGTVLPSWGIFEIDPFSKVCIEKIRPTPTLSSTQWKETAVWEYECLFSPFLLPSRLASISHRVRSRRNPYFSIPSSDVYVISEKCSFFVFPQIYDANKNWSGKTPRRIFPPLKVETTPCYPPPTPSPARKFYIKLLYHHCSDNLHSHIWRPLKFAGVRTAEIVANYATTRNLPIFLPPCTPSPILSEPSILTLFGGRGLKSIYHLNEWFKKIPTRIQKEECTYNVTPLSPENPGRKFPAREIFALPI